MGRWKFENHNKITMLDWLLKAWKKLLGYIPRVGKLENGFFFFSFYERGRCRGGNEQDLGSWEVLSSPSPLGREFPFADECTYRPSHLGKLHGLSLSFLNI